VALAARPRRLRLRRRHLRLAAADLAKLGRLWLDGGHCLHRDLPDRWVEEVGGFADAVLD
jgi:hypothetical protein